MPIIVSIRIGQYARLLFANAKLDAIKYNRACMGRMWFHHIGPPNAPLFRVPVRYIYMNPMAGTKVNNPSSRNCASVLTDSEYAINNRVGIQNNRNNIDLFRLPFILCLSKKQQKISSC